MKKILTLLLFAIVAITACKKETPKKTAVENLPGKVFKSEVTYNAGGLELTSITFFEFKSNNEYIHYRRLSSGDVKTIGRWESMGSNVIKIKSNRNSDLEDLTGVINEDTIIMSYQNGAYFTYTLVKDFEFKAVETNN